MLLSLLDHLGRKPTSLVCFVGALAALYAVSIAGPIAAEAAPVALMSTAIGVIGGASEIFGGGVAPAIAGWVARHYGLRAIFYLAMADLVFGFLVTFGLRETAPRIGNT